MKMKIADRLGGKNAVIIVLVLALLAQMPHAQYVFFSNSHDASWFSWFQSWGAAVALEVAVLVFVIRSNTRVSWGFAAFSILINLMYYYDVPHIAPLLLAAGLPVAIALYSHEVAAHQHSSNEAEEKTSAPPKIVQRHKPAAQPPELHSVQDVAKHTVQFDALPIADADGTIATMQGDVQPDRRTRALQLHDEGLKPANIAAEVDAPLSTVQSWIRRHSAKLNGVHKVAA